MDSFATYKLEHVMCIFFLHDRWVGVSPLMLSIPRLVAAIASLIGLGFEFWDVSHHSWSISEDCGRMMKL